MFPWDIVILDPPKTYTQDGVCLTESGMTQLQSLTVTVPRRKRSKPKLKLKIINQNSVAVLQTPPDIQSEHSRDGEMDDSRGNTYQIFHGIHVQKTKRAFKGCDLPKGKSCWGLPRWLSGKESVC